MDLNVTKLGHKSVNVESKAPFKRNRFCIDFDTDEELWLFVSRVAYTDDHTRTLSVTFKNFDGFFSPEFFEKNKYFDKVRLYFLNNLGEKRAVAEFDGVTVTSIVNDELNYETEELFLTHVNFTFDFVKHKTL